MDDKNLHSNNLKGSDDLFQTRGSINWKKSEADVWAELDKKISAKPEGKSRSIIPKIIQWSAAAVLFLLVGLIGVVSTYTKSFEALPGEHILAQLPDGSTVDLNAGSIVSYYPLKWRFERKLKFEGEAYFKVEKGSKFSVESKNGTTQVLGTSFTVYSRDENYRVTCLTGKVKVSLKNSESVVLSPNNRAIEEDGKLKVTKLFDKERTLSWKNNYFDFAGRPLKEVIDEIERQYAVTIKLDPQLNNRNLGSNFSRQHSVEDVLKFVCGPLGLKFEKQSENVYLVVEPM